MNEKAKSNKGYALWAKKYNLKTMADSVLAIRQLGINSKKELEIFIEKSADKRQVLLDKIQIIESKMDSLSETMEHVETIRKYREHYKYNKNNPSDQSFLKEYSSEIQLYTLASKASQK